MKMIDIHADDYALSPQASEDILSCLKAGYLDSISVLTNMSCFRECARKYQTEVQTFPKQPSLSVHLNFMEGHCVAETALVSHLIDEKGYFSISWGKLLYYSYNPKMYKTLKAEIKAEIKAQTKNFQDAFGTQFGKEIPLRFDGHQHTQMIPIVYSALLEYITEDSLNVSYIRVTKEPILPFVKKISLWNTYRPTNWIKNILLNYLSVKMERKIQFTFPNWNKEYRKMLLWGVLMSGKMDKTRIELLFSSMLNAAIKKERVLEIFFHPGHALVSEMEEEFTNHSSNEFYLSENRTIEKETVSFVSDFLL